VSSSRKLFRNIQLPLHGSTHLINRSMLQTSKDPVYTNANVLKKNTQNILYIIHLFRKKWPP